MWNKFREQYCKKDNNILFWMEQYFAIKSLGRLKPRMLIISIVSGAEVGNISMF